MRDLRQIIPSGKANCAAETRSASLSVELRRRIFSTERNLYFPFRVSARKRRALIDSHRGISLFAIAVMDLSDGSFNREIKSSKNLPSRSQLDSSRVSFRRRAFEDARRCESVAHDVRDLAMKLYRQLVRILGITSIRVGRIVERRSIADSGVSILSNRARACFTRDTLEARC